MNVRAPTQADFDAVLDLAQAADVAVIGETDWTEDMLRDEWREIDLEHDAFHRQAELRDADLLEQSIAVHLETLADELGRKLRIVEIEEDAVRPRDAASFVLHFFF